MKLFRTTQAAVLLAGSLYACAVPGDATTAPTEDPQATHTLLLETDTAATATALANPPNIYPTTGADLITISGRFITIFNEEPHFSITDDQGQTTELLIDEEVARASGGTMAFNRQRVTVVGEVLSDPAGVIQVLSIRLESDG